MYLLRFQKVYEPYKVIISVDKSEKGLFLVRVHYQIDEPYETGSNDKAYKENDLGKALVNLTRDVVYGNSKFKKIITARRTSLSARISDLCKDVVENYSWAKDVRSYPPKETPSAETGDVFIDRSLTIQFPLRLPIFNYLHKNCLHNPMPGEDNQTVTYYLNLTNERAEGCIEIFPGKKRKNLWAGDFLKIKENSPNVFLAKFKDAARRYLNDMNEKGFSLFDVERDSKSLERFVVDAFSEFYADIEMPTVI